MWRIIAQAVAAALVLASVGCDSNSPPQQSAVTDETEAPDAKAKIEQDLADQQSLQKSVVEGTTDAP